MLFDRENCAAATLSDGRGERIRTSDLSVPNRAHYQAVLRPVLIAETRQFAERRRHSSRQFTNRSRRPGIFAVLVEHDHDG